MAARAAGFQDIKSYHIGDINAQLERKKRVITLLTSFPQAY